MLYFIFRWQKVDAVSQCFSETFHGCVNMKRTTGTQQVECKQPFPILNISLNKLHLCCPNPESLVSQDTKIMLVLICCYILTSICKALQNILIQRIDSKCFVPNIAWSGLAVQSWDLDVPSAGVLSTCMPFLGGSDFKVVLLCCHKERV